MFAALPTAHQPFGANGVQFSPAWDGRATATATATTPNSTEDSASWHPDDTRSPKTFAISTTPNIARPTATATDVPEAVRAAT